MPKSRFVVLVPAVSSPIATPQAMQCRSLSAPVLASNSVTSSTPPLTSLVATIPSPSLTASGLVADDHVLQIMSPTSSPSTSIFGMLSPRSLSTGTRVKQVTAAPPEQLLSAAAPEPDSFADSESGSIPCPALSDATIIPSLPSIPSDIRSSISHSASSPLIPFGPRSRVTSSDSPPLPISVQQATVPPRFRLGTLHVKSAAVWSRDPRTYMRHSGKDPPWQQDHSVSCLGDSTFVSLDRRRQRRLRLAWEWRIPRSPCVEHDSTILPATRFGVV
ncbi:hypothetical protein C8R44DRAFT_889560 [Mycena epipterygia]|nr:hypothetical protein C8R44DRAFT_889560 [Mycena epipterygia]